ncbi:restriction endonuclease subunit S [Salipiger sp. 1_MG-2023]|uniref:restriction endonuclease subunit S n=1 Tax=Salipiger sp. 1_MG-2023 TaxID=3062665 RepID=UPI0026E36810|nr:restriction endonuclease subunit S [Salipiger sp. 1_MG-2023]MDO6588063.1 restriction endonuclease subunit S [Salipiger sp. 1_MG-2023]
MSDEVTLSRLIDEGALSLQTGPFGSQLHSYDYQDEGVPVIPTEGIQEGRIDHSVLPKITRKKAEELRRHRMQADDILFARRGAQATGRTARIRSSEEGFICGTGAIRARVENCDAIDPKFLAWYLATPSTVSWIREQAIGATMPNLNKSIIGRIALPSIPVSEQKRIARLLNALDDKIELNRRMSATLEAMARALYRSWFVDFDPVHARALGQPPAHMDATTAALFPDSFGPDGLPKGWEMSTIGEVAETVGGATPKTKEPAFWDGPHRWATPRDLSRLGQPVLFETDRTLTDAGLAKISSGLSPAGTVLLSSRAPIGYVAIAQNPVAVNQGFIALRETDRISSVEAYFWVQSNMDAILANANGSTFQEISKKNFRPLPCVVAPDPVRNAFRELAGTWFDRVAGLCAENANLATLRDTLLPRLMSGELRIREAQTQVEAMV